MSGASRTTLEAVEAALAKAKLFQRMGADARRRLAATGAVQALEPRARLFSKGDEGDAMYVVLEGEVEVRISSEGGRDVRIAALGAGSVIGEMAALDGGPRSADVDAVRRTRLLRIPRDSVVEAMRAEPDTLIDLVAELSRRLRDTDAALEDAALLDLGGRLARLLLREAGDGAVVSLTQVEMARRIGASREKVNRKLHEWCDEGIIALGRSGVRIVRRAALEGVIEDLRAR
ncbi:MAG: cyclic nucleotide-binding domain-containing protein [Alphaproteobacteria bacterium]|nr:cyclic nucleotide-binding domain-containing protein [Alphaproteobacteria bacterium]